MKQKRYICFTCYKHHPEMKGVSEEEFKAGKNVCDQETCPLKGQPLEEAFVCNQCGKLYPISEHHSHMISYDDFAKLEIKIGKIIACEKVENADKLLKLTVDFGNNPHPNPLPEGEGNNEENEIRTIVSGIAEWYKPEDLVGKLCPFLTNLEPRMLRGVESQGMILAAGADTAILLHPDRDLEPGTKVR